MELIQNSPKFRVRVWNFQRTHRSSGYGYGTFQKKKKLTEAPGTRTEPSKKNHRSSGRVYKCCNRTRPRTRTPVFLRSVGYRVYTPVFSLFSGYFLYPRAGYGYGCHTLAHRSSGYGYELSHRTYRSSLWDNTRVNVPGMVSYAPCRAQPGNI